MNCGPGQAEKMLGIAGHRKAGRSACRCLCQNLVAFIGICLATHKPNTLLGLRFPQATDLS